MDPVSYRGKTYFYCIVWLGKKIHTQVILICPIPKRCANISKNFHKCEGIYLSYKISIFVFTKIVLEQRYLEIIAPAYIIYLYVIMKNNSKMCFFLLNSYNKHLHIWFHLGCVKNLWIKMNRKSTDHLLTYIFGSCFYRNATTAKYILYLQYLSTSVNSKYMLELETQSH